MKPYPTKDTDDDEVYNGQAEYASKPTLIERLFPHIGIALAIIVIMAVFSYKANAQVGTPFRWATGKTYTNVVFLARENGNSVQFGIEGQDWNKVSFWVLKSDLLKVGCPKCPVCPPPVDVKTTKEYKDVLALLAQKIDLITAKDNQLNQLNNQFNELQAKYEQSSRDNEMLVNDSRRRKAEEAKYIIVPFKIPRAMLDSLKRP